MKILGNKLISECTAYDFKGALERRKIRDWLKSVSAFANKEGGALYFGVANDGTVVGLENIQSDSDFISEKVNAHLDPIPDWTLTPAEDEEGHKVLELLVKPGQFTPYYLFLDGSRQAYVRS
ncbi:MAG: ATP-binding protein, partial [Bacteroidales bacterium]|nr:ATP-binding protein [Bacteroidales bacterium]